MSQTKVLPIKVLWIEDDPEYADAFILNHEDELNITHFTNWADAYPELSDHYKDYDAILLDARCKVNRDSMENAAEFLVDIFSELRSLSRDNHHLVPWYVLSGGDVDEFHDRISKDRKQWDGDWDKNFYSKGTDQNSLVERMIKYVNDNKSLRLQIRAILFRDVFQAMDQMELEQAAQNYMIDLLEPFVNQIDNNDYNHRFNDVRRLVEAVFIHMYHKGLLHHALLSSDGKAPNLSLTSLTLLGDPDKFPDWFNRRGTILNRENCKLYGKMPKIMADNLKNIIFTAGSNEHHNPIQLLEEDRRAASVRDYQNSTGNTSYLLKSFSLQICDFILWYNHYLLSNP